MSNWNFTFQLVSVASLPVTVHLLLFSKLRRHGSLSLSLYVMFPNPMTVLVAIYWTCSSLSFVYWTQTPDAVLKLLEGDKGSLPWIC